MRMHSMWTGLPHWARQYVSVLSRGINASKHTKHVDDSVSGRICTLWGADAWRDLRRKSRVCRLVASSTAVDTYLNARMSSICRSL
jgi:hypothetical protein